MLTAEELSYSREAYEALPIGVYLVTLDGQFLEANTPLRTLLELPLDVTPPPGNIRDFYVDPQERERLMQRTRPGSDLYKEVVQFRVGERELSVQMSCRLVLHAQTEKPAGYLGSIVDVTEERRYHELFDHLPAGVYELDAEDRVCKANDAFARLHGYGSQKDILGTKVQDLYVDPTKAARVREKLLQEETLLDENVELKRTGGNGEVFVASLNASAILDHHRNYVGRQGTIIDITREWRYRKIIEDIPVGLYVAERRGDRDILVDCNQQFAEIHEISNKQELIGININQFHGSDEESEEFLQKVESAARDHKPLLGETLRIQTNKGNLRTLEVNVLPLLSGDRLVQRTGAVRDITEEDKLRDRISQITSDIGRVLHLYTQTLMQLNHIFETIRDVLGPDPFKDADSLEPDQVKELTARSRAQLTGSLGAMIREVETASSPPLETTDLERLKELLAFYENYVAIIPYEHLRGPALIDAAVEIQGLCRKIVPGRIGRDYPRQVQLAAQEVARINTIRVVRQAQETIAALDYQVGSVRAFVIADHRRVEPFVSVSVVRLASLAVEAIATFARARDVELRVQNQAKDQEIRGRERDMIRALGNLLHNAIKYSWQRPEAEQRWVTLTVATKDDEEGRVVFFEIENFGVPIPADEIEGGRIFQLGLRGRFSSDRGRQGTGIGLADTLQVVLEHGGKLEVESRPAHPHGDPLDYKQPFLTKFTIEIPIQK